ncbi:MAG TPA: universal stress protein [Blastocatellia bacterium]|jgi:nucleotide-binding universal stress UspA family protein|nr:universal stress protein [Blastocatellia bacterium]
MSIKNILVLTDFSENAQVAFEKAHDLARQLRARLYVLHVRDESNLRIAIKEGLLDAESTDEQLQAAVERLTEDRFSKLFAGVDRSQVEIGHLSRRGDSDAAAIAYAKEINADIIVIGRHGAGVMHSFLSSVLGSVAETVIKKSPCPVLVVRRDHGRKGEA